MGIVKWEWFDGEDRQEKGIWVYGGQEKPPIATYVTLHHNNNAGYAGLCLRGWWAYIGDPHDLIGEPPKTMRLWFVESNNKRTRIRHGWQPVWILDDGEEYKPKDGIAVKTDKTCLEGKEDL